jgi:hypothetical protein
VQDEQRRLVVAVQEDHVPDLHTCEHEQVMGLGDMATALIEVGRKAYQHGSSLAGQMAGHAGCDDGTTCSARSQPHYAAGFASQHNWKSDHEAPSYLADALC